MIVLSPHLDDAALSTFSVLTGDVLGVVNVFTDAPDGSQSLWDRVCGFADSGVVARRRQEEDERALATLGIRPLNLGFRDASVRTDLRETAPTIELIVREISFALPRADTYGLTLYAPLGGGPRPNPDHVLVRDAARSLARRDSDVRLVLYADQPYVYKSRKWPTFIDGRESNYESHRWWGRFPRAVPEMVSLTEGIEVVRLDEAQREDKLMLMAMYETQFENLNTRLRTRGLLRDPELYGVEVYWRLP